MAHCPSCVSFRIECNPEPEDYDKPCEYFKNVYDELEKELGPELEQEEDI